MSPPPRANPTATKLAASCVHRQTARAPTTIANVPVQGIEGIPPLRDATATPPATKPKANAATALAAPNSRLSSMWPRVPASRLARSPSAAPRSTIATSATVSGASSAVPSAENAAGNAENKTVMAKISHTWFASHSGPIAISIAARSGACLPASRSRMPAPKSPPANRAYAVSDMPRMRASRPARLTSHHARRREAVERPGGKPPDAPDGEGA